MRRGDGLIAKFDGGPADGLQLQVRGTEVFIAVINGRAVEFPSWPDQKILQAADDIGWTRYVVVPEVSVTGGVVRYVPA